MARIAGQAKPRRVSQGASDHFARRVNDSLFNFLVVEISKTFLSH
jgi:hypothetical protein